MRFAGLLEKKLAPPQSDAALQEAVEAALGEVAGAKAAPRFVEALRRSVATIVEGHRRVRGRGGGGGMKRSRRVCASDGACAPSDMMAYVCRVMAHVWGGAERHDCARKGDDGGPYEILDERGGEAEVKATSDAVDWLAGEGKRGANRSQGLER